MRRNRCSCSCGWFIKRVFILFVLCVLKPLHKLCVLKLLECALRGHQFQLQLEVPRDTWPSFMALCAHGNPAVVVLLRGT